MFPSCAMRNVVQLISWTQRCCLSYHHVSFPVRITSPLCVSCSGFNESLRVTKRPDVKTKYYSTQDNTKIRKPEEKLKSKPSSADSLPKMGMTLEEENKLGVRLLLRGFASFLFGMAGLGIYIQYKRTERDLKLKESKEANIKYHDDEHVKGSAKRLALRRGCWLPTALFPDEKLLDKIWNFPLQRDDILVVSFPKSGTTWVQEIVYLIHTGLDFHKARQSNMEERFPYLEFVYPGLDELAKKTGPRLIKSHLPYHHLPNDVFTGKGKIIYIARNPKDVLVSYYHFVCSLTEVKYTGTVEDFGQTFIDGTVPYGPWVIHVKEFLEMQSLKGNILFITYEDLQEKPEVIIARIARFLNRRLSKEQISQIAQHCSFEEMKKNPAANYSWWDDLGLRDKKGTLFMRKGQVGDWKNHNLSEATQVKINHQVNSFLTKEGLVFRDT